jgi:hypothetical protein
MKGPENALEYFRKSMPPSTSSAMTAVVTAKSSSALELKQGMKEREKRMGKRKTENRDQK